MGTEIASQVRVTGGARVGWVHASWPLATLTASATSIVVSARMIGTYELGPDDVVALEPFGFFPLIGKGVQIIHTRADVPERIIFFSWGNPEQLIARVRQTGFAPRASAAAAPQRSGIPVRLLPVFVAVAAWNAAFLLDSFVPWKRPVRPGPLVFLALALVFITGLALPRWPRLQAIVMKPGRSINEIRGVLNLLQLVSGFIFLGYLLFTYLAGQHPTPD